MHKVSRRAKHSGQSVRSSKQRHSSRVIKLIVLLPLLSLGFVAGAHYSQQQYTAAKLSAQTQESARIDAQVKATLQKRLEDARSAEATARANADAEKATRAALTGPSVPLADTANPTNCAVKNPDSLQVVVNKKHCLSPLSYTPSDLTELGDVLLRREAAEAYNAMVAAAAAAGQPFSASSSFRSYETQITTYNHWVSVSGSAQADSYSARPGYSEHQTGLAVDLKVGNCALSCFNNSTQYAWLRENAAEFGYILRYPDGLTSITGYEAEPWHWRYVGKKVAQDMKAKGIETLEIYSRVTGGDYAR